MMDERWGVASRCGWRGGGVGIGVEVTGYFEAEWKDALSHALIFLSTPGQTELNFPSPPI